MAKPSQTIVYSTDTLKIADLLFKTGSSEIEPNSIKALDNPVQILRQNNIDSVLIIGHADSVGTFQYNMKLSQKRAESVANYFKSLSIITGDKIFIRGVGYLQPMSANRQKKGEARDRRVEIILYRH